MEPYQRASESIKKHSEKSKDLIKGAANIGLGAVTGGLAAAGTNAILRKIVPFLSEFIPAATALKGISKVSPNLSKFIGLSLEADNTEDDIVNFIREKVQPKQEQEEEPNVTKSGNAKPTNHKVPYEGSIKQLLATGGQPQQPQQQLQKAPQEQQQSQPQSEGGPGQQALMQILNQINQRLGNK